METKTFLKAMLGLVAFASIIGAIAMMFIAVRSQSSEGMAVTRDVISLEKEKEKTKQMEEQTKQMEAQRRPERIVVIPPSGFMQNQSPHVYQNATYPPNSVYSDAKY